MSNAPPPPSTLLPEGLYDLLPHDALKERLATASLLDTFAAYGYDQVSPPLLEFEDALLSGKGAALASQTFRVMDPSSHRMLGLRADLTMQVARIALSRLSRAPRPLRLSYAGPVLRIQRDGARGERMLTQAGIELIGISSPAADAEVIIAGIRALEALGLSRLSVDLNLPGFWESALEGLTPSLIDAMRQPLERKEEAGLRVLPEPYRSRLTTILAIGGNAGSAVEELRALDLPAAARRRLDYAADVISRLSGLRHVSLTLDPIESRGLDYHEGLSFSLFSHGVHGEIGSGGGYICGGGGDTPECHATGLTLYLTAILPSLPDPAMPKSVYVPYGVGESEVDALHEEGIRTVRGLSTEEDPVAEARRLGCRAWWNGRDVVNL